MPGSQFEKETFLASGTFHRCQNHQVKLNIMTIGTFNNQNMLHLI